MTSEGEESNWDVPVCCVFLERDKNAPFLRFFGNQIYQPGRKRKRKKEKRKEGKQVARSTRLTLQIGKVFARGKKFWQ